MRFLVGTDCATGRAYTRARESMPKRNQFPLGVCKAAEPIKASSSRNYLVAIVLAMIVSAFMFALPKAYAGDLSVENDYSPPEDFFKSEAQLSLCNQEDGLIVSSGGESSESVSSEIVAVLYSDGNLFIRLAQEGDDNLVGSTVPAIIGNDANSENVGNIASGGSDSDSEGNTSSNLPEDNNDVSQLVDPLNGHVGSSNENNLLNSGGSENEGSLVKVLQLYSIGNGLIGENGAPWYESSDKITCVVFGQGIRPVSMANWFKGLAKLKSIDFGGLDTSQVSDMQCLFSDCQSLVSINTSKLNTSGVKNMEHMFAGCKKVIRLDLSSFNTSLVTSMNGMFYGLSSMQSVNLKSFDTSNVVDMTGMFSGCSSVKSLNLSSFTTPKLESLDGMFEGCTSLSSLDVSNFTAEQLTVASVPLDNEGGFWRLNVPEEYETNIELRAPTEEELKAAEAEGETINSDPSQEKDNPSVDPHSGEKIQPSPNTDKNKNIAVDGSNANYYSLGNLYDAEGQYESYVGDTPQPIPVINPVSISKAITAGLTSIGSSLAVLLLGPLLDPSINPSEIATATTSVLSAANPARGFDRTMAIATAIIGMIIAAGLLLTFVFKLR